MRHAAFDAGAPRNRHEGSQREPADRGAAAGFCPFFWPRKMEFYRRKKKYNYIILIKKCDFTKKKDKKKLLKWHLERSCSWFGVHSSNSSLFEFMGLLYEAGWSKRVSWPPWPYFQWPGKQWTLGGIRNGSAGKCPKTYQNHWKLHTWTSKRCLKNGQTYLPLEKMKRKPTSWKKQLPRTQKRPLRARQKNQPWTCGSMCVGPIYQSIYNISLIKIIHNICYMNKV